MNVAPPSHRGRDDGVSLIELLIAVTLLSIAVIGVMPALWANVHGSALQDRFAASRRWLVSAGDFAASPTLTRLSCASNTTAEIITAYEAAVRTGVADERPSSPWTDANLTITSVLFWNGTTFTSTCVESTVPSLTMQQITLRIVSPDGGLTESLDVVKSE